MKRLQPATRLYLTHLDHAVGWTFMSTVTVSRRFISTVTISRRRVDIYVHRANA